VVELTDRDHVTKHINHIVCSLRPGLRSVGCLSYYVTEAGTLKTTIGVGCYGGLQEVKTSGTQLVLTVVQKQRDGDTTTVAQRRRYVEYLIEKSSFKVGFNCTVDDVMDKGVAAFNTDAPANLMMLAIMSIRQLWEKPHRIQGFCELIYNGVLPNMAFLLSESINGLTIGGKKLAVVGSNRSSHRTLCYSSLTFKAAKNFLLAETPVVIASYKEGGWYRRVHLAYHPDSAEHGLQLNNYLAGRIKVDGVLPTKTTGVFGKVNTPEPVSKLRNLGTVIQIASALAKLVPNLEAKLKES
jgi:hypothetical protein